MGVIVPATAAAGGASEIVSASYVAWLDAPREGVALGGKAAPLARLMAAGLPVPAGFIVVPSAFREEPPAGALERPLKPEAVEAVRRAYEELGERLGERAPKVAVRSSATAEDLAGASFAGQYETFLWVSGEDDLITYLERCWLSLWSDHAMAYRAHHEQRTGQTLPPPAMAVLVQALVVAETAGVAFTAHPVTGDRGRVLVNAGWGLGQSIVDGEVEADSWSVDRESLAVVEEAIGWKPTRTGAGPEAPREPIADHLQRAPSLTAHQAIEVARLALRAEAVIGTASDVEWALDGERVWLLQARPITTGQVVVRSKPAAPGSSAGGAATGDAADGKPASTPEAPVGPAASFPFEWPEADLAQLHWRRSSVDQRRSEVLRPLEQDVRARFNRSFQNTATLCGRPKFNRAIYLNGYEFVAEATNPASEGEQKLRAKVFEETCAALTERGESYRAVVQFPVIDAGNERLGAVDLEGLSPADLAAHVDEALAWYERLWTDHWMWAPDSPANRFVALYKELFAGRDTSTLSKEESERLDSEARALLTHEPNLLTDAVDGLLDLARIAQREPALRALLESARAEECLERLPKTADSAAFWERLEQLLATQGLRSGAGFGTEQRQLLPGWREAPAVVIALVQKYLPQDLDGLLAARQVAIEERDRHVAELREQITDEPQRERFDFWLAAARRQQRGFEDHNYKIDSASTALLHRALAAAARRLAGAGVIPASEDVWWLRTYEIVLALQALDTPVSAESSDGKLPTVHAAPHWHDLVPARRAEHAWRERLVPPPWLGAPPPPRDDPASPSSAEAANNGALPEAALVKGQSGSAGKATGRVRLVSHEALVPDVEEGDVLVARNAGPLWTPVFPLVAAVVLDEGAFFQHAMLTCREYGVPAVFQTKTATQRLLEGQRVTVDGDKGLVLAAD